MSKRKRRNFTDEFKEEAVKLVTEEGYKISEAARSLGIHENLLGRWKKELSSPGKSPSSSHSTESMETEIKRLRKENKRLKMEREILKKATAFFVKETS
jgi:transposase